MLRIRIVPADGVANHHLAAELGTSRPTVWRWRRRFEQAGVEGLLEDAPRPGRKKRLAPEKEEAIVNATLYSKPAAASRSIRPGDSLVEITSAGECMVKDNSTQYQRQCCPQKVGAANIWINGLVTSSQLS